MREVGRDLSALQALTRRPALTGGLLLAGLATGLVLPLVRVADPTVVVVVLLAPETRGDGSPGQSLREQAGLARVAPVAAEAAAAALRASPGLDLSTAQLERRLRVSVGSRSSELSLAFDAPTRVAARAGATAAAAAYVRFRSRQLAAQADVQLTRLDALDRELMATSGAEAAAAREEVGRARATALLASTSPETQVGTVLPPRDARPGVVRRTAALVTGLAAALFPALVLGHRAESRRARQHGAGDARGVLGAPALGVVTHRRQRRHGRHAVHREDYALAADVLWGATTHRPDAKAAVIVVVGASRRDPWAGPALAELAWALAERGARVVVVTASVPPVLAGRRTAPHAGSVAVVPLSVAWREEPADLVLLDGRALLGGGVAGRLAAQADAALVLVPRRSSTARLDLLRRRLEALDVPAIGYLHLRSHPGWSRRRRPARLRPSPLLVVGAGPRPA